MGCPSTSRGQRIFPVGFPRWFLLLVRLSDEVANWRDLVSRWWARKGDRLKPLMHPRHRANLLQHARRLRLEGTKVRESAADAIAVADLRAGATFGALSLVESAALWNVEREGFNEWLIYAATILEAGAGGVEPLVGDEGESGGSRSADDDAQLSRGPADNDPDRQHGDRADAPAKPAARVAPRSGDDGR